MKNYEVVSGSTYISIKAENCRWENGYLAFFIGERIVACFTEWCYWKEVIYETQSS